MMIRIDRADCPPHLLRDNLGRDAWKNAKVRKALWEMQYGKCCYCERNIPYRGALENIEHFRPQGLPEYEDLRNDWGNLLLACAECNQSKSAKFPTIQLNGNGEEIPLFLDPSDPDINPEQHITFKVEDPDSLDFASPTPNNESIFGKEMINEIDFESSTNLRFTFYQTQLSAAYLMLSLAKKIGTPKRLVAAINLFETFLNSDSQFTSFAREWARYNALNIKFDISIPYDD